MKKVFINNLFQPDNELTNIIKEIHHSTDEIRNIFVKELPVLQSRTLAESKWYSKLLANLDSAQVSVKRACTLVNEKQLLDKDATCLSTIWQIVDIQKELIQLRETAAHWLHDNTPAPDIQDLQELENSSDNHRQRLHANIVNLHKAGYEMMTELQSHFEETIAECYSETTRLGIEQYNLRQKVEQLVISYTLANSKRILGTLKINAQKFKTNHSEKLNAMHWGKMMEKECELYHGDTEIMKVFSANNNDEELWCHNFFSELENSYDNPYLNLLNNDNIMTFCECILRRNLILCEMTTELRPELDQWLSQKSETKTDVKETSTHTHKTDKETIAIAEKMAARLCLCKHWTANITATQIHDFTFGIMGINNQLSQTSKTLAHKLITMLNSNKRAKSDSFRTTTLMIVGYLQRQGKIAKEASARDLCRSMFNEDNWHASISKTRNGNYGKGFKEILPLIDENIILHLAGE